MRITKDKLLVFIRKLIKIFIIAVIVAFLPDLLFQVRILIKGIPLFKKLLYTGLSDKEYVQIMMSTLINCVAVSVSIFAYYVARTTGRTQIEQHEQEIIMSAKNISRNIKKNSYEIFDIKNRTGDIKKLLWDDELEKCSICLFTAKKITLEQKKTWQSYVDKLLLIIKYHEAGEEKSKEDKINEYCNKFFKEDSDRMEFSTEMHEFINVLNNVAEGE